MPYYRVVEKTQAEKIYYLFADNQAAAESLVQYNRTEDINLIGEKKSAAIEGRAWFDGDNRDYTVVGMRDGKLEVSHTRAPNMRWAEDNVKWGSGGELELIKVLPGHVEVS